MNDTKNPGDTLSVSNPNQASKTLTLKRPSSAPDTVRQSFSHGRTKTVVVETVKRRPTTGPAPVAAAPVAAPPRPAAPLAPAPAARPAAPAAAAPAPQQQRPAAAAPAPQQQRPAAPTQRPSGMVLRTLSSDEQDARTRALAEARQRESEERKRAEEEAARRAAEESRRAAERAAAEARMREEEERHRREEETRRRGEEEARRRLGETPPPPREERPSAPVGARPAREGGFGERRPPREGGFGGAPREGGFGERREGGFGDRRPGGPGGGPGGERRPPREGGFGDRRPGGPGAGPGGERRPPREGGFGGAPREGGFGDRRPGGFARGPGIFEPPAPPPTTTRGNSASRPRPAVDEEEGARAPRRGGGPGRPGAASPKREPGAKVGDAKSRGRLTVTSATGDEEERTRSVASFRRRVQRMTGHRQVEQKEKIMREVVIPEAITIQELANRMTERAVDVIRLLMKQGEFKKINDVIDADTAQLIAEEMGHTVKRVAESDVEEGLFDGVDLDEHLDARPPVVTIMGHVDHGKTSLLDAIRSANVVAGEAGGITQHIGAYQVKGPSGRPITFIDTPGHAAFTAMRARGAKVTDIVVLVVAADDGVMPQTVEAINHAQAAKVPLIVAVNKIDKPDARPERVRTELLQHNVQVESMGGETQEVEVSAKMRTNLDGLLEAIELQSEILNLQANANRAAEGTVIEARLDRGRGPVATVLVQRGTLNVGDILVAGSEWGRVRALVSDTGDGVESAGPSMPVEVLGFNGTPEAGDRVAVVDSEARARDVTGYRQRQKRERAAARIGAGRGSLVDMMSALKAGAGAKELPLVVKGDVQGSVEAIVGALEKVGNDEVKARVIHAGVGGITESDITLAEASGAAVIGFNVRAHKEAREAAERTGTEIRYYNIIYDLVDDIKAVLSGLLAPTLREEFLGNAEILEVFNITKVGKVAGCRVTDGRVERGANVRLIRDNVVIHEGKLSTLKRFKDEVKEVQAGQECGMAFENYQDIRAGDVIECYRVEQVKRTL